jgi:hypothetical protein
MYDKNSATTKPPATKTSQKTATKLLQKTPKGTNTLCNNQKKLCNKKCSCASKKEWGLGQKVHKKKFGSRGEKMGWNSTPNHRHQPTRHIL